MLSKRHLALSYHRVHEAIAAKIIKFCHVDGKKNVADVMTKFLARPIFWPLIELVCIVLEGGNYVVGRKFSPHLDLRGHESIVFSQVT